MSRFATAYRVFVVEEPLFDAFTPYHEIVYNADADLYIITPHLGPGLAPEEIIGAQQSLLDQLIETKSISSYILWYYSPMALEYTSHLKPKMIIYDCMDELSAFKFAPENLRQNEATMFERADLVFTGGNHLYEAKQHLHNNIYAFPAASTKSISAKQGRMISTRWIK